MPDTLLNKLTVAVLDGNANRRSYYASAIEPLGVELEFHSSIDQFPSNSKLAQVACFIINFAGLPQTSPNPIAELGLAPDRTIGLGPSPEVKAGMVPCAIGIEEPVSSEVLAEFVHFVVDRYRAQLRFSQQCQETDSKLAKLTERQYRVLKHSLKGLPAKTIAQQLDVSQRTVESDKTRIMEVFATDAMADIAVQIGEYRVLDTIRKLNQREAIIRLQSGVDLHLHDRHLVQFNAHYSNSRRADSKS
ncbi:MAG: LuxR C-terminal-related transcriptional regulator [Pirellulaceae bacterium]